MNLIGKEIARGLRQLERAIGSPTFTWNGAAYPCTPGRSEELKDLGMGGFAPQNTLVLNVRAAVLPDPGPQPKQSLQFQDYTWRIARLSSSPESSWIKIICEDPNAAA